MCCVFVFPSVADSRHNLNALIFCYVHYCESPADVSTATEQQPLHQQQPLYADLFIFFSLFLKRSYRKRIILLCDEFGKNWYVFEC